MFALGMDFSSLEETEALGGVFRQDGAPGDLVELLAKNGVNAARLRLWNDPYGPSGEPYGGGTNDLPRLIRLARRAKEAGMRLLLDLHYSDFWCDPARQLLPKAWRGLGLPALCERVETWTAESLDALARAGLSPDFVQVGNEITNGMLWPAGQLRDAAPGQPRTGYDALSALVKAGCQAVRAHSGAAVVLHLERSGDNARWREWCDEMFARGVDCDLLGASYYPYWHGGMDALIQNLSDVSARYDKDVAVVETGYGFTVEPLRQSDSAAQLVIRDPAHTFDGEPVAYPLTREGQDAFLSELLERVFALPDGRGKGVFYWEPGWLPVDGSTWATEAARVYMAEQSKPGGNEWANQCLFDYNGNANPGLRAFARFAGAHPDLFFD